MKENMMTDPNDLADRLDAEEGHPDGGDITLGDLRAAAAMLRQQAEQLDTLRNERDRLNELLNELPDHNHRDCCLNDLRHAAADGGVPEEGATRPPPRLADLMVCGPYPEEGATDGQ